MRLILQLLAPHRERIAQFMLYSGIGGTIGAALTYYVLEFTK